MQTSSLHNQCMGDDEVLKAGLLKCHCHPLERLGHNGKTLAIPSSAMWEHSKKSPSWNQSSSLHISPHVGMWSSTSQPLAYKEYISIIYGLFILSCYFSKKGDEDSVVLVPFSRGWYSTPRFECCVFMLQQSYCFSTFSWETEEVWVL